MIDEVPEGAANVVLTPGCHPDDIELMITDPKGCSAMTRVVCAEIGARTGNVWA